MKQEEVLAYAYEFVSILMEKTRKIDEIILFGSVASGEFDKHSDVDIFIDTKAAKEVQKSVDSCLEEFERTTKRNWSLRGIYLPIKPIVGNLSSSQWSALRRDVISCGITLFGRYKELPKGVKQRMILSFQMSKLDSKSKIAFIRRIYGYSSTKAQKIYEHKGLLQTLEGIKMGANTISLPAERFKEIYVEFKKAKIPFKVWEVWM